MMALINFLKVRFADKKGQGLVEYGLILGIIAVVVVAALTVLRAPLNELFVKIGTYLSGQSPT